MIFRTDLVSVSLFRMSFFYFCKGKNFISHTQVYYHAPFFCLSGKTETIKKVLQYVDIVGLVSFLSPFGFVLM
ncbi:hypothetical protein DWX70_21625 [Bacteroides ovatus]|uniref:Uncharacterized protein n=1 Tax=Bacteroides ovatus TaxID=28116 RepID=A0A395VVN2_BACOV|nr:hypothetical protein DWX70_21625 [Bacteroides ovatus]